MTDTSAFVLHAESELIRRQRLDEATCQQWAQLSNEAKAAFAQAMLFLGCQITSSRMVLSSTSEDDRIAAAKLMLLKLGVATDDPRWSSEVLDRLLRAVTDVPDGSIGDLLLGLFEVLGKYAPRLSNPLSVFIKEAIVKCYTRYQQSYEMVNWKRVIELLENEPNAAQLYLAVHAIPHEFVSVDLAKTIVEGLSSTGFRDEVAGILAA